MNRAAVASCAALLLLFGALSWLAARGESATCDEPMHAVAGFAYLKLGDYRLNVEHPILWKEWAALPQLFTDAFHIDTNAESWRLAPGSRRRQAEVMQTALFDTPGNGTEQLFDNGRFMMLLVGIALGATIAWWAWRIAGPIAGTVALIFYAFDPSFLAHAPIVTNDISLTLAFLGLTCAAWHAGRAVTVRNVIALALLSGAAVTTKHSGLLAGPIIAGLLALRAFLDEPWTVLGRSIASRGPRLGVAFVLSVVCAMAAYGCVWATYGFRRDVSPDPTVHMDLQHEVRLDVKRRLMEEHPGRTPTDAEIDTTPASAFVRTMLVLDEHHLLPEPYLDGLMYQHAIQAVRSTFLLGEERDSGSIAYFPIAILVKTPVSTLMAVALAVIAAIVAWKRRAKPIDRRALWLTSCLVLPPAIYFALAMGANLNIGLRHVFPVYPFVFIGLGLAAARAVTVWPRSGKWIIAVLATSLAIESLIAFPNYLSFFNAPAGGARGGIDLLGDSNLDWGQGLKKLQTWQADHPDQTLGLAYFGGGDPVRFYGVRATNIVTRTTDGLAVRIDPGSDVTGISATLLQGVLLDPASRKLMQIIRRTQTPIDVVGETIYLFRTNAIVEGIARAP